MEPLRQCVGAIDEGRPIASFTGDRHRILGVVEPPFEGRQQHVFRFGHSNTFFSPQRALLSSPAGLASWGAVTGNAGIYSGEV